MIAGKASNSPAEPEVRGSRLRKLAAAGTLGGLLNVMNERLLPDQLILYKMRGSPTAAGSKPFRARVSGNKIFTDVTEHRFEEGDRITRHLPNGAEEEFWVVDAVFRDGGGMAARLSHWEIEVSRHRSPAGRTQVSAAQTIHISGGNVQIGNSNSQAIGSALSELVTVLETAKASAEQKEEAKGLLRRFLAHPLVTSIVGGASGAIYTQVFKGE